MKLIFGQDTTLDVVYINSKNLISLEDYYTKEEINTKIDRIDSSIEEFKEETEAALENLREYTDSSLENLRDFTEKSLEDLREYTDSSIENLRDYVDDEFDNTHERIADVSATVEDISNRLVPGIVHSVKTDSSFVHVDPSQGHVKVDVDIIQSENKVLFENTGVIADGYFEERMAWTNFS